MQQIGEFSKRFYRTATESAEMDHQDSLKQAQMPRCRVRTVGFTEIVSSATTRGSSEVCLIGSNPDFQSESELQTRDPDERLPILSEHFANCRHYSRRRSWPREAPAACKELTLAAIRYQKIMLRNYRAKIF